MSAACKGCNATTLPLDESGRCLTCVTLATLRRTREASWNGHASVTEGVGVLDNRATAQPPGLAAEPVILDALARDLARCGLVGEDRAAKLVYLAAVSRLLPRPVSVVLKGPSSGGKSFTVETVLAFFPDHAYHALTGGSDRSLAYSQEPLRHRMLVIYEAAGVTGDLPSYFLRSLLSEGRLRYETVESTAEGVRARLIEREGPTGVILTTTAVHLHPENETRMLSVPVTDTREQTRQVLRALAAEDEDDAPDLLRWWQLQELARRRRARGDDSVSAQAGRTGAPRVGPAAARLLNDAHPDPRPCAPAPRDEGDR